MRLKIGSQILEDLKDTGVKVYEKGKGYIKIIIDDGKKELWYKNKHHCGYTLRYNNTGYEYGMDLK